MYDAVKQKLELRLPPFTLIVGGRQTGKTTLAKELVEHHGFKDDDTLWVEPGADVSFIDWWLNNHPISMKKVLVIDDALNTGIRERLLAWTEDQPKNFHIIILARLVPADTIMSRAEVFMLNMNLQPSNVPFAETRGGVLALLRAFEGLDTASLDEVAKKWTDAHTQLLVTWCQEKLTKSFKTFSGEEVSVPDTLPMMILRSLVSDVRPRFLIRGPLAELMESMK